MLKDTHTPLPPQNANIKIIMSSSSMMNDEQTPAKRQTQTRSTIVETDIDTEQVVESVYNPCLSINNIWWY